MEQYARVWDVLHFLRNSTMVHDEVSRTLAEAQTRRMSHIFSDATSWVHRTFACNQTCQEGWELLPQKTYTMLVESLST